MITDQATNFLTPGQPGWAHGMNDIRGRSASPAPSQMSYGTMDNVPIDPNLLDGFSDYVPSRAVSEEPGFIAPSQLHRSCMPSPQPMRRYHNDPDGDDFFSQPARSRCQSEEPWLKEESVPSNEPWPGMPDAVLTSMPSNNMSHPMDNPIDSDEYWQIESLDKNESIQGFSWDTNDWEVDDLLHIP